AAPNARLTVRPTWGTVVDANASALDGLTADADPELAGFQIVADANGVFAFGIRRGTGDGPSVLSVEDVLADSATGIIGPVGAVQSGTGSAATPNPYPVTNVYTQTFQLPTVRRFDFGPTGQAVASDSDPTNPNYLGISTAPYTSRAANAFEWFNTSPTAFD